MSKSTKIIAGLGAVAMLGVAAMPLSTFAYNSTVTGSPVDVKVRYDVDETLAMTITNASTGGAAAYDEDTHNHATVDITNGQANNVVADAVRIQTNAGKGYTVKVAQKSGTGSDAKLSNGDAGTITGIGSAAEGTAAVLSAGNWGMYVDLSQTTQTSSDFPTAATGGADQTFKSVQAGNVDRTVVSHGDIAATIDETSTVHYGVQKATDQPSGTYAIDLTYTASINSL